MYLYLIRIHLHIHTHVRMHMHMHPKHNMLHEMISYDRRPSTLLVSDLIA